jgi:hypothetical protein
MPCHVWPASADMLIEAKKSGQEEMQIVNK